MRKTTKILLLSFTVIIGCIAGIAYFNHSQQPVSQSTNDSTDSGVGLKVSAEKDFKSLKKNSDLIVNATVDENFDTDMVVEDKEFDLYLVRRIFTGTVNKNFKDSNGTKYKKGDEIKFVYPVGFQQIKDGQLVDELAPLDEVISFESGEYLLFLDEINGQFYFSNINHVYKKQNTKKNGNQEYYNNIATDSIPTLTEDALDN